MLDQDKRQDPLDNSHSYLHSYPLNSSSSTSSNLQTRHFVYHQSAILSPFAQFLKKEDERFFETFPDARRAAQEQQQQLQWSCHPIPDGYGDFHGSTGFFYEGRRNCGPSSPEASSTVIDAHYTHDVEHCSYPLDIPGSTGVVPYTYPDLLSPDTAPSHDFNTAYYGPMQSQMAQISIDNTSPPDHQFQQPSPISPVHSSAQFMSSVHPTGNDPPIMDYLPSPESTETVYSAPEEVHQLYSVSPETPTLPPYTILPSSGSPEPTMPPRELSLSTPSDSPEDLGESSSSPESTLSKVRTKGRRRNRSADFQGPSSSEGPRSYMYKIPLQKPTPSPAPKLPKPRATAAPGEKKSLALACFFCRGRKIACGPQDPNSSDRTCNQCHRRSLKCEYPTESRRGMRKRKLNNPPDPDFEAHGPKVPIPSMSKD